MAAEPATTTDPPQRRELHVVPDPAEEAPPPWPPIPDEPDDVTAGQPSPDLPAGEVTTEQAGLIVRMLAAARSDLAVWWLVAARPRSLADLLGDLRPSIAHVPDGSRRLRALWIVDNHLTGLACATAAVVAYLAAGALLWLAGHPARRWAAIVLAAAVVGVLTVTR